jgi:hypothetical protein
MKKGVIVLTQIEDIADGDTYALMHLLDLIETEAAQLREVLGPALEAQWQPSVRENTENTEVKSRAEIPNPTLDTVMDGRRMALRAQVLRSERIMRQTAINVRGVRRGLERALDHWEGA